MCGREGHNDVVYIAILIACDGEEKMHTTRHVPVKFETPRRNSLTSIFFDPSRSYNLMSRLNSPVASTLRRLQNPFKSRTPLCVLSCDLNLWYAESKWRSVSCVCFWNVKSNSRFSCRSNAACAACAAISCSVFDEPFPPVGGPGTGAPVAGSQPPDFAAGFAPCSGSKPGREGSGSFAIA